MNDVMVDRAADFEEALRLIAKERTPCMRCGKPHERREVEREMGTGVSWADPEDGHSYWRMSAASFATMVLETS